jgi:hypothetical protein
MHNKLNDHLMAQHTDRQGQKRASVAEEKKLLSQGDIERSDSQAINSSIRGSNHNQIPNSSVVNSDKGDVILSEVGASGANQIAASENGTENVEDLNKRNFYLSLFNIYSSLPFTECLASFTKIFNDVFVLEKPLNVQKYFLTECQVVEMNESYEDQFGILQETHSTPFSYNFAYGTSR